MPLISDPSLREVSSGIYAFQDIDPNQRNPLVLVHPFFPFSTPYIPPNRRGDDFFAYDLKTFEEYARNLDALLLGYKGPILTIEYDYKLEETYLFSSLVEQF